MSYSVLAMMLMKRKLVIGNEGNGRNRIRRLGE
jgi:hypothetical protein